MPLLLILTACIEPDARPYADYLADLDALGLGDDTGPVGGDDSAPTDDSEDPGPRYDTMCSEDGGAGVEVTLVSGVDAPADLYWIDSACQEWNLALMVPGDELGQGTYVGHVFRLKDAFDHKDWVAEVRIAEGDGRVVMEGQ